MVLERIAGPVGRREHLDVEPLEQGPREEVGGGELVHDLVVDACGGLARESVPDAEHLVELIIEPHAAGRAAEQVVVVCKALPHAARIHLNGRAVLARHTQCFERDPAGIKHPQDVMVRLHDQGGGLGERLVLGQDARIHVAMGRYDRQLPCLLVQRARDAPHGGIGIETAVGVEDGGHGPRRPEPSLRRALGATPCGGCGIAS